MPNGAEEAEQRKRLGAAIDTLGPETVLRHLYRHFLPPEGAPAGIAPEAAELDACRARLAASVPALSAFQFADDNRLTDLERIVVFKSILSRTLHEPVWLHHALAESLNRLLLGGVTIARVPCLLHCFLALMHGGADRANEPVPRTILSRELGADFPRDALLHGFEALSLGYHPARHDILAAAKSLGPAGADQMGDWRPPLLKLTALQTIARRFELPFLDRADLVSVAAADGVVTRTAIAAATRTLPPPEGDASHVLYRAAGETAVPRIDIHEIAGGIFSLDIAKPGRTEYYVFDRAGRCISELSYGINPFIAPDRIEVTGRLAIIDDLHSGAFNISHFLLDRFSRLALHLDGAGEPPSILLSNDHPYHREIFALAGLSGHVVRPGSTRFSIAAEKLLVSSNIAEGNRHPAHLGAAWALNFLRARLIPRDDGPAATRRIAISRADAHTRNIAKWDQVEPVFRKFGFEIVTLADLSAARQIELFRSASHVVGVHGAGLTNVVFTPPHARVMEILPVAAADSYWILCAGLGRRYRAFAGDDPEALRIDNTEKRRFGPLNSRDIVVPAARLDAALAAFTSPGPAPPSH